MKTKKSKLSPTAAQVRFWNKKWKKEARRIWQKHAKK